MLATISTRGASDALVHANTFGLFGRDHSGEYLKESQQIAYLNGRLVGDAAAIAQGGTQVHAGTGTALATGGETLGIGAIVGLVAAGHGLSVGSIATSDAAAVTQKLATLYMASSDAGNSPSNNSDNTSSSTNTNPQPRKLKKFSNNVEPDVSIENQLAGKSQLRNLRNNPNLQGYDIDALLRKTPRQIEEEFKGSEAGNKVIKQINKAFEGRDLGKGH